MSKFGFITNKYTVSALILGCLLLTDIILHRGISRVIIPTTFSDKIIPVNLPLCNNPLLKKDKHWISAVNNISLLEKLPVNTAGIECDLVFNTLKNNFEVCTEAGISSCLDADSLLAAYAGKKLQANIWFALNNLDQENTDPAIKEITRLKNKYKLAGQIVIESSAANFLKAFCDSGYFTSYAVPAFNPYKSSEAAIIHFADSVRNTLTKYPASAVSGNYFQYPILKKFFPNYPILTKTDNVSISIVSYVFKKQLENDENIKVILYPFKE